MILVLAWSSGVGFWNFANGMMLFVGIDSVFC